MQSRLRNGYRSAIACGLGVTTLVSFGLGSAASAATKRAAPVTLTITGDYSGASFNVTDNWW